MATKVSKSKARVGGSYPGDVMVVHVPKPAGWPKGTKWNGWRVVVVNFGTSETVETFSTQSAARMAGREFAKNRHVELTVCAKKTGRIVSKTSYGNDPRGSKG